ncbi:hypothetical protein [Fluviispira multicolorata]|uniref:Oligosaccharide repeat unit polymerase n=1 Tax=Fluviispira multicolorata TaxID=2654512 RepID=A0A833JC74_9BACT|nr:hypothetical protein [Fluviispira multicolorata]KAB8030661.1 hypothetical protein GCL57_06715 [Fluviispira multicolorata]
MSYLSNGRLLLFLILIVIFTQRVWVNGYFPLSFLIFYIIFILLVLKGKMIINKNRFLIFIFLILSIIFSSGYNIFFSTRYTSLLSILYFFLIYITFIFSSPIKISLDDRVKVFNNICILLLLSAFGGILQFLLQYINIQFDPLSNLPAVLSPKFYNIFPFTAYMSAWHKSNGIIFLEPSFFSQFMAVALILEILFVKKYWRIPFYIFGIITSYSGSGFISLIIFALLIGIRKIILDKSIKNAIILLMIMFLGIIVLTKTQYGEYIINRLPEVINFSQADSSGYIRFFAPIHAILVLLNNADTFLFGIGSGLDNFKYFEEEIKYPINPYCIAQIFIYFGIIPTFFYIIFIYKTFIRKFILSDENILIISVLFMYLFASGALLTPNIVFFILLMNYFCNTDTHDVR